jgi:integration host factor subunit alpha
MAKSMGRAELVALLSEKKNLSKQVATCLLDAIIKTIIDNLSQGKSIKIPGFGTFSVRHKNSRPGRNPRTGEEVEITSRKVVTLRTSPLFKEKLDTNDAI